jgi:hypothetical protein
MVLLSESLLVVLATTLSGGLQSTAVPTEQANATCSSSGTRLSECVVLDSFVSSRHLAFPWIITLATMVVLSMPTVILRSRSKEKGLRSFACNLLQCFGLLACSLLFTDHPSICFTFAMHSCVRLLAQMEVSDGLVGGIWWWGLRYLSVIVLLCAEITAGPAISVVRWPGTPIGTALPCAYLAHLSGCIIPDLVLVHLRWLISMARYVHVHDD